MKTFNPVYDGEDVLAQARTGTGKTFSFAIPLVERLQKEGGETTRGRPPKVINRPRRSGMDAFYLCSMTQFMLSLQVLVLTPTRELAIQVAKDFKDVSKKLAIACFYGGSSYNPQRTFIPNTRWSFLK